MAERIACTSASLFLLPVMKLSSLGAMFVVVVGVDVDSQFNYYWIEVERSRQGVASGMEKFLWQVGGWWIVKMGAELRATLGILRG